MDSYTIESFITFCDDMIIAEESMRLKEFHKVKKDTTTKITELEKKANDINTSIKERIRIYKSLLKVTDDAIQTVKNMQPDNWDRFFNILGWLGYIAGGVTKTIAGVQHSKNSFNNTVAKKVYAENVVALANIKSAYRKLSIKYIIIYASAWGVSFVGKKNTLQDKQKTKDQLISTFSKKYIQYDAEIKRLERMRER